MRAFPARTWRWAWTLVLLGTGAAFAGDPVVAKTLLENGKKAVNARKYDDGIALLRKALQEDPALAEAAYWIATARDKNRDELGALAGYREFLAILDRKGDTATAEEKKLRATAEKRVEALAAGEKEFQKLEDRYLEELLAFARERRAKDPAAALAAVDIVLRLKPKHEEAKTLRTQIDPSSKVEDPFAGVASWNDYIARELFTTVEGISYGGGMLTVDQPKGRVYRPSADVVVGKDYAIDAEFRVVSAYEQHWAVGVTLGQVKDAVYTFSAKRASASLDQGRNVDGRVIISNVAVHMMEAVELGAWHRIGVVVRGNLMQCWFNGEMVLQRQAADRADLEGINGIWTQGCKVEWRRLRTGKL